MSELLREFQHELDTLHQKSHGDPTRELQLLLQMALEREEIVVVAYRSHVLQERLESLAVPDSLKQLIKHCLFWAWKDEEMHSIYTRGLLLRQSPSWKRLAAFLIQWAGAIGGWVSATRQHISPKNAPFSYAAASVFVWLGLLGGKIPKSVLGQLRKLSIREFFLRNIDPEETAAVAWQRIATIAAQLPSQKATLPDFARMAQDERLHANIFALLAESLDDQDQATPAAALLEQKLQPLGELFSPIQASHPLRQEVVVFSIEGKQPTDKEACFHQILQDIDIEHLLKDKAFKANKDITELRVAIKLSFMMGTHRNDTSHLVDRELVSSLSIYFQKLGIQHLVYLESPNLYDQFYQHRTVHQVAAYFGYVFPGASLVDVGSDQVSHNYTLGYGQRSISAQWRDADVRISFAKLRSHPVEQVYLSLGTLEGLGARVEDFLFADRQAQRHHALLMTLKNFPPDLAIVEGYDSAADGLLGVMGCRSPKATRRIYASRNALALDLALARQLGVKNPEEFPILAMATSCFGSPQYTLSGVETDISPWRTPYQNAVTTFLSVLAGPMYEFGSDGGRLFVAPMDETAFPPREPISWRLRTARRCWQALLGL